MLASAAQPEDLQGPVRVEVSDPSTGALRYAVPGLPEPLFAQTLAVQADGVSVFSGSPDRLAWASPGAPSMHPVGRVDCPAEAISVADGRIAYHDVRSDSLRVADLDGRADTLIRRAGGLPFDWNGARLLVRGLGCGEDFLGERSRRGAAYRGPPCHVRVLGAVRGRSRAVARVTVECKPGCRGDVELLLGHEGDYDRATVRLRHAGRRAVRIRLRAHARRLLRSYRRVPFHATMTYTNPADGASSQPLAERSGILRGDGRRSFPPRRPRPPD